MYRFLSYLLSAFCNMQVATRKYHQIHYLYTYVPANIAVTVTTIYKIKLTFHM